MAVDVELGHGSERGTLSAETLAALTRAVIAAAGRHELDEALLDLAQAARLAARADAVAVRVLVDGASDLGAVAVAASATLAAELEGDRLPLGELPAVPVDSLEKAPPAARRAAARAGARSVLLVPVELSGHTATLELFRSGPAFTSGDRHLADLVAGQVALVLRAFDVAEGGPAPGLVRPALELAGEALAAALDDAHAPGEVVRLAAGLAGARAAILWELSGGRLAPAAVHGADPDHDLTAVRLVAEESLAEGGPVRTEAAERLPGGIGSSTTVSLGRPPVGALQLLHAPGEAPTPEQLVRLTTFGVRAAHALRASVRARTLALELEQTRALLSVVAQATAELSVAHTLETAVDRVVELLGVRRIAVYLRSPGQEALVPAVVRGVTGPHTLLAEQLLDVALGPARGRAVVELDNATRDPRLRNAVAAAHESGIRAVLAVPLLIRDEVIGLLAIYGDEPPRADENERSLLAALGSQLAVAVQNAQLHEQATRLGEEREAALSAERAAARRLGALYEVSRSFAQTMSLGETLNALVRTVVDVLDVDAAVIRSPDERREQLLFRDIHVKDSHLAAPVRALLGRPTPYGARFVQRVFRDAVPVRLGSADTRVLGTITEVLASFIDKGWTIAMVPIAKPGDVIASLTLYSFRPDAPISDDTIEAAAAIAAQAALAIDNARLYQQQKQFADTMQRSLLPRSRPSVPGLEVGEVYESSARVEVGGDVYDFLALDDGRLAVVLGDVTGHGVEATADMAMAKFVFRSLAREHPEPADFLAAANEVVVEEIATGKFITMAYVVVDAKRGEVACGSAGHPPPRLVLPDEVRGLGSPGLVLGVDAGQSYEETHADLPPGSSLVLYTDGVVEARSKGELYGVERLDVLLALRRDLSARALAEAVTEEARSFAGGELSDDLAVVVIRRTE
jgi:serine phosphatase RsbU (regulator of sigma subunit)